MPLLAAYVSMVTMTVSRSVEATLTDPLPGPGSRVVAVVAHPDDETFGCGSLIAACVGRGATVSVVCATRGERGERIPDPATDHLALGVVREQELRAAGAVLGVSSISLLGYADSGFDGELPANALCGVPAEQLAVELMAHLVGVDVLVILDGSDGHRDHRHLRDAVELVVEASSLRPQLIMSCLANSLMRDWVSEMSTAHPDTIYLDLDVDSLGCPNDELTMVDTSQWLDIRERAIACHRSQHSPYESLSSDLRRRFLSTDHVVVG